jgi:hypothetical protein
MSIFEKDFLERLKSRGASAKPQESVSQSENGENGVEQQNSTEELAMKARAAGPLILGPCVRSRVKGSWREEAICLSSAPAIETPRIEPQPLANASGSLQSAHEVLPVPIPLLPASWWQGLLYGSRDALVSPRDANTALRLVACELGKDSDVVLFTDSVRVNTLRKMLDQQFGAKVWDVMNKLWRASPASPGAPLPSEDQSQLPAGPLPVGCNQPRWIRELNELSGPERAWMVENRLWCG